MSNLTFSPSVEGGGVGVVEPPQHPQTSQLPEQLRFTLLIRFVVGALACLKINSLSQPLGDWLLPEQPTRKLIYSSPVSPEHHRGPSEAEGDLKACFEITHYL